MKDCGGPSRGTQPPSPPDGDRVLVGGPPGRDVMVGPAGRDRIDHIVTRGVRTILRPNLDEVALVHELLRHTPQGVLVDVGAHYGSSLVRFADDGWQVFAFEPDPANRAVLLRQVDTRPNVVVDARAVAAMDGDEVTLYTSGVSTGISTLAPFHASHRASGSVETVRLDTYLADVSHVTVLKVDTEGFDLPVLRTFPWQRLHPLAVVCEFEDRKTLPLGYDYRKMAEFLVAQGYHVLVSEWYPVVEYGLQHRWRDIRPYPTNLLDPKAWGNLIAVDGSLQRLVLRHATYAIRLRAKLRRLAARVLRPT